MWHDVLIFARLMVTDGLLWQVVVVAIALVLALKDIRPKYVREVLTGLAHAASLSVVLFALYAFFGGLCMHYRFSNPAILQALSNGLAAFKGNLLFSSHDHQFIDEIANRVIELVPGKAGCLDRAGSFEEFLAWKKERSL